MDEQSLKSKVLQFFTAHPLLGFIGCLGSLASIIGLLFSFFPWWSAPKKDLSFCINPVRTPIVQIAKRSDVSVSYKGKAVDGDVTAVQIAIWNAGREPIKADDVLKPIILHTATNQIIESLILKTTRNVCEFQLTSNNIGSNSIGMKWRILEHDDGALLQIVYSGDSDVPLTLDGILVGQPYPKEVASSHNTTEFRYLWVACALVLMLWALSGLGKALDSAIAGHEIKSPVIFLIGYLIIVCTLIAILYPVLLMLVGKRFNTPFAF
jgi:hypothetical protein